MQLRTIAELLNHRTTLLVIAGVLSLGLVIAPLIPSNTPNRTEKVFVYGTLLNPWIRAYACHCRTKATPATLLDHEKVGLTISPRNNSQVAGAIIAVDRAELAHLDTYENVPNKYRREQITINNSNYWVYIKN